MAIVGGGLSGLNTARLMGEAGADFQLFEARAQFGRIFGPAARAPTATLYKDWAADPLTATAGDLISTGHPASAPDWVRGPWGTRLILAGSETSPNEAGYLAGAAEASRLAAGELARRLNLRLNLRTGRP